MKRITGNVQGFVNAQTSTIGISFHLLKVAVIAVLMVASVVDLAARQRTEVDGQTESRLGGAAGSTMRPFTVADSIAMTHLADPAEHGQGHPQVSPDGKRFLIITERGILETNVREYTLFIYERLDESFKPARIITFKSSSNRPGISQAKWLDDENISILAENPGELPQVYAVRWRSREAKKLTSQPTGVAAYDVSANGRVVVYYGYWTGNEAEVKYKEDHGFAVSDQSLADLTTGNWRHPQWMYQMFIMDTASREVRLVHATPFQYIPQRLKLWVSPDGRYAVTEQPPSSVESEWANYEDPIVKRNTVELQGRVFKERRRVLQQAMILDTRSGELGPLFDAPLSSHHALNAVWGSDSKSVIVEGTLLPLNTSDESELTRRRKFPVIAEVSLPSHSFRRVTDIPEGQYWIIRSANRAHSFLIDAWKLEEGDVMTKIPTIEFRQEGSEWLREKEPADHTPASDIIVSEAVDHWPRLVKIDPVTHQEKVILDPNPELQTVSFGREEFVHWKGKRGEPLVGGLIYPTDYRAGTRCPLVIQTHGFNEQVFLPDGPFTTVFAAQELANRSVAVLQLGESPLYDATQGTLDWGPAQLSQVESAIDYLDERGLIDRERVGLVGFSITGFIVRYALENSKYKFAVATSAEGNDYGYWAYIADGNNLTWASQNEAPYGGAPWSGNLKSWMQSISFNYDKIRTPLRLESDSNDFGAVLNEWENFIALRRLHKPVELIYEAHGMHPVVKPWDRMTSQQGNVDWLLFWLKGEEDPDPAKAEQYNRWHELRKQQEANQTASAAAQ